MERFFDFASQPAATREAVCPEHGGYESLHLFPGRNGGIWSRCPGCNDSQQAEERRVEQAEEAKRREVKHQQMLDAARIPPRFIGRSFENFAADDDNQRRVLSIVRDYAENFAYNSRKGMGLILSGSPGTGKSHLAGATLQAVLSSDVRYLTCLDLIRAVRATWRKDSEKSEGQVLNYFGELDLLVIDEVGVQYGTDGEQTILFDVLDRRYRDLKSTILITNQDKEGFEKFVGERTFDRLKETCKWISFAWESYRPIARKEAA